MRVVKARNSPEQLPQRSAEEVQKLFSETEDLIGKVLGHLRHSGVHADPEELMAFGRQGLVEAATRFDPAQGEDFRRFAYFRVKGAMLDGVRKMNTWSRRGYERVTLLRAAHAATEGLSQEEKGSPDDAKEAAQRLQKHMAAVVTAMATGVFADHSLERNGSILPLDTKQNAEEQLAEQQLRQQLRSAVSELPPPEDEVIQRFYVQGDKMDEIADDLGKSRSWVSRVHTRALKRLGARLRSKGQ